MDLRRRKIIVMRNLLGDSVNAKSNNTTPSKEVGDCPNQGHRLNVSLEERRKKKNYCDEKSPG